MSIPQSLNEALSALDNSKKLPIAGKSLECAKNEGDPMVELEKHLLDNYHGLANELEKEISNIEDKIAYKKKDKSISTKNIIERKSN